MGTFIVSGVLLAVVVLIAFNIIRRVRRGGSAFCSSCDCGCGQRPVEKTGDGCCCSSGQDCGCHEQLKS